MDDAARGDSSAKSRISRITTRWPQIGDPAMFCVRYGTAIRKYIVALLRDDHDADEVAQEFLLRVVEKGFPNADPDRGRFRDYLKTAVRNAALMHLRARRPHGALPPEAIMVPAVEGTPNAADAAWLEEWRSCILDRAWRAIETHQRKSRGNLFHTVLRLSVDCPDEESSSLAARVRAEDGQPIRADAFRKQLSRARRFFAERVAMEVAATLENPTRERVEEELGEVGLLEHVRGLLRDDWDPRGAPHREE